MDKIVFDSFKPNEACYEKFPTDPQVKDECKVETEIHEVDNPASALKINFYRDKTLYLFAPEDAPKVPRLRELGLNDQDTQIQNTISFALAMLYNWKVTSLDPNPKLKAVLSPLGVKMINFFAAGNLEKPDETQRKALGNLLSDLSVLPDEPRETVLKFIDGLLKSPAILEASRPRVEWLKDQILLSQDIQKAIPSFKGDEEIRPAVPKLMMEISLHVFTDQRNLKSIQGSLDDLQKLISLNPKSPKEMKDLYSFFLKKLEPMQNPPPVNKDLDPQKQEEEKKWLAATRAALSKNLDARQRANALMGFLRKAGEDKRAELISMEPGAAFRRYLRNELVQAATINNLPTRVREEMKAANLSPDWIKDNAREIVDVVIPHLTLVEEEGKPPRVKVDVKALQSGIQKMVQEHGIQEREFNIGTLAVLRFLFGKELNNDTMEGWVGNDSRQIELSLSKEERRDLKKLGSDLRGEISSSLNYTDVVFPIVDGSIAAGGIGLIAYGIVLGDQEKGPVFNPFYHAGAGALGFGLGSLTCNLTWKQRNAGLQFLTDTLCGVVLGAATTGLSFAVQSVDATGRGKGSSNEDGRNPTSPYGP